MAETNDYYEVLDSEKALRRMSKAYRRLAKNIIRP